MFLTECKKMWNVELESLKTCMYQVSSTAKNFEVPEPYPSQKGNLGKQFEETIVIRFHNRIHNKHSSIPF